VLQRCRSGIIENWLTRVKKNKELNRFATNKECTGYRQLYLSFLQQCAILNSHAMMCGITL
jgi:hypothetical protein